MGPYSLRAQDNAALFTTAINRESNYFFSFRKVAYDRTRSERFIGWDERKWWQESNWNNNIVE